jgi:hypothetical protein
MKVNLLALAVGMALTFPSGLRAADAPATEPLSPDLTKAIAQLTADDYQERQQAVSKIEEALAANVRQLLLLDDPEARNRMSAIMEFNAGLSRWAIDVVQLPKEQRQAVVLWGTSPEGSSLVAKIYSAHSDQRVEGVKDLAKRTEPATATLLATLITDDDRTVRLAAIAAAGDRPVNAAITDALWNVATGTARPGNRFGQLTINGGQVNIVGNGRLVIGGNTYYGGRYGDESAAMDALIHLKDPSIPPRVRAFLEGTTKTGATEVRFSGAMSNDPTQRVLTLAAAYQVTEALPSLMKIVTGPVSASSSVNLNGQASYVTNRTAAMATVCLISGQKLDDYKLHKSPEMNQWATTDAAAEGEAATRLAKWYDKYQQQPATAPATQSAH